MTPVPVLRAAAAAGIRCRRQNRRQNPGQATFAGKYSLLYRPVFRKHGMYMELLPLALNSVCSSTRAVLLSISDSSMIQFNHHDRWQSQVIKPGKCKESICRYDRCSPLYNPLEISELTRAVPEASVFPSEGTGRRRRLYRHPRNRNHPDQHMFPLFRQGSRSPVPL